MQSSPGQPFAGAGEPPADLVERARRLGSLPCSALGVRPAPADLPVPADLAAWESGVIDRLWQEAGEPDPFTVVEFVSGDGSVARQLLGAARPACAPALRLVLVEPDPMLRRHHADRLPVEYPALLLGPVSPSSDPDEDPRPQGGIGPLVTSLAEPPVVQGWCAVLAVGWLSRLPCDVFEWREGKWHEVRLVAGEGQELMAVTVELDEDRRDRLDLLVPGDHRSEGARFAGHVGAAEWMRNALAGVDHGWLVAADRWVERTSPLPEGPDQPVALDQMPAPSRQEPAIESGPGGLGTVRWRIG